jgi:hypothetical protein
MRFKRGWLVAVLVAIAASLATVILLNLDSTPGLQSAPLCNGSQIKVEIGKTYVSHYRAAISTPISSTNTGKECRLVRNSPTVEAVSGPKNDSKNDIVGFPAQAFKPHAKRVFLATNQTAHATIQLVAAPANLWPGCKPETAIGMIVTGYANPSGSEAYFRLTSKGVCSGGHSTNLGVIGYQ